ncbi:MAG TPA: glyoxylate/hydroxypyruvate reductase A [Xanthobacteraceae bacterium]|jgi:glyoxylate/hydroxypyruvate reductase A
MPSPVLIAVDGPTASVWHDEFRRAAPEREYRVWNAAQGEALDEIVYACVWRPPAGLLARLPRLQVIFNLAAGVDPLLADPTLPDVPIVRTVHPNLTMRMVEYVVLHVLMHHRGQRTYDAQQRDRVWHGHEHPAASEVTVGIMGVGAIGTAIAAVLRQIGYNVIGWSRTPKTMPGVEVHAGPGGLDAFLAHTEILVCLLPHTRDTEGIVNLPLLRRLKHDGALGGAYLINAGRGKLQVDADILAALDQGAIAGASLDVFPVEPLPPENPLWGHPNVIVTPHNAGDLSPPVLVQGVLQQMRRREQGLPLEHVVDRTRGY